MWATLMLLVPAVFIYTCRLTMYDKYANKVADDIVERMKMKQVENSQNPEVDSGLDEDYQP